MTVYVDESIFKYGRMKMCHMWADTLEELHQMADKIGINRKWFQQPPKASWEHYDICLQKKRQAIMLGAVSVDRYTALEHQARKNGNMKLLATIAHSRGTP